jgi:hypothetical protein
MHWSSFGGSALRAVFTDNARAGKCWRTSGGANKIARLGKTNQLGLLLRQENKIT